MAYNYKVKLMPAAERDLDNIFAYYLEQSKDIKVAIKVIKTIKDTIFGLDFMPSSHPALQSNRHTKTYRKLICGDYIMPFRINEDKNIVFVARVFNGKLDYQNYI